MTTDEIKQLLEPLPHLPGVYRYFNSDGELIYVGKAKDLRKRVTSYFTKKPESRKTRHLVDNIHHLEFTIVDTERDALLLENSLIKHHQPRYNLSLKDDKTYPYIVIKNERFPRIFLTRNVIKDGSEYFGPYTNVGHMRGLLELIRTLVPIRTNNHNLFLRITDDGNLRVNPEYYMKEVTGEQEELLSEEEYSRGLEKVRSILNGRLSPLETLLQNQIRHCVEKLEFEKAHLLGQKLDIIKKYETKNVVVDANVKDLDVFTIHIKESQVFVNYLNVRSGDIVSTKTVILKIKKETSRDEMLLSAIVYLRKKLKSEVKEIVVPLPIIFPDSTLKVTIPQRGIKRKLLDLSRKNLIYFSEKIIEDKE